MASFQQVNGSQHVLTMSVESDPSKWTPTAVLNVLRQSSNTSVSTNLLLTSPTLSSTRPEVRPQSVPLQLEPGYNPVQDYADIQTAVFDDRYDFDFTKLKAKDEHQHVRGHRDYKRPCGFKKFGLDVSSFCTLDQCTTQVIKRMLEAKNIDISSQCPLERSDLLAIAHDRLRDNEGSWWLGCDQEPLASDFEWCVAYHGTTNEATPHIAKGGLQPGGADADGVPIRNGAVFGEGIYCSPNVNEAAFYAPPVAVTCPNNDQAPPRFLQVVFQCRVRPESHATYDEACKNGGFYEVGINQPDCYANEYWVVPNSRDVRPYAILMRECDEYGFALDIDDDDDDD